MLELIVMDKYLIRGLEKECFAVHVLREGKIPIVKYKTRESKAKGNYMEPDYSNFSTATYPSTIEEVLKYIKSREIRYSDCKSFKQLSEKLEYLDRKITEIHEEIVKVL